ncbi:MAG: GDSL-type esterase/lipase family protein [Tannerellaceae bacterium]|nr:GDSL-type esterase/lipase family protein [Tannerellaceae bacterium]
MMKQKSQSIKLFLFFSLFVSCLSFTNQPQEEKTDTVRSFSIADTLQSRLSFITDSLLSISDPQATLTDFATGLIRLKENKDTVLRIVHLGDSHIQAGFLSGRTMRLLHKEYGNAGRGWIAPLKLNKTNEPFDYFIHSNSKEWIAGRCVQTTKKCPVGLGGIGIETTNQALTFTVGVTPRNGAGYGFNEVLMYRYARALPMEPTGWLKNAVNVSYDNCFTVSGVAVDTFRIACQADTLSLRSLRTVPNVPALPGMPERNLYYGFEMRNGEPGILYHSIGINGAMFVNYSDEKYLRQLILLKPDILIVSLGTNETFGRRFNEEEFTGQVRDFVQLVKHYLPDTPVLLTTPAECYKSVVVNKKKNYNRNQQTVIAARSIIKVAKENGLAYRDLFTATGGINSCENWYKGKWMGADRIHFNQQGYEEQGILLFKALNRLERSLTEKEEIPVEEEITN